jgi:hypothetical protein
MDLGAVPNKKFSEHFPEAFLFGGFFEGFVYNFSICEMTQQISQQIAIHGRPLNEQTFAQ